MSTGSYRGDFSLTLKSEMCILTADMKPIFIGKGMYRIIVRSKEKREKLARIPEVRVEGTRVIFPEWLSGNIRMILNPKMKRRKQTAEQMKLF